VGVPGIYFHSLFGSRGWRAGVELTGRNRTINRQKFDLAAFESELDNEGTLCQAVFRHHARYLQARSASPAFHPHGGQQVLDCGEAIFALLRLSPDGNQRVLCLHNISDRPQSVSLSMKNVLNASSVQLMDLITNRPMDAPLNNNLVLHPYQTLWLRIEE
jgi:sucrose phosphorylase